MRGNKMDYSQFKQEDITKAVSNFLGTRNDDDFAILCPEREGAEMLLSSLHSLGRYWTPEKPIVDENGNVNNFKRYGGKTCLRFFKNDLGVYSAQRKFYENSGFEIIELNNLINEYFNCEEDVKTKSTSKTECEQIPTDIGLKASVSNVSANKMDNQAYKTVNEKNLLTSKLFKRFLMDDIKIVNQIVKEGIKSSFNTEEGFLSYYRSLKQPTNAKGETIVDSIHSFIECGSQNAYEDFDNLFRVLPFQEVFKSIIFIKDNSSVIAKKNSKKEYEYESYIKPKIQEASFKNTGKEIKLFDYYIQHLLYKLLT